MNIEIKVQKLSNTKQINKKDCRAYLFGSRSPMVVTSSSFNLLQSPMMASFSYSPLLSSLLLSSLLFSCKVRMKMEKRTLSSKALLLPSKNPLVDPIPFLYFLSSAGIVIEWECCRERRGAKTGAKQKRRGAIQER